MYKCIAGPLLKQGFAPADALFFYGMCVFEAAVQKILCDTSFFLVQNDEPNEFFLGISTK